MKRDKRLINHVVISHDSSFMVIHYDLNFQEAVCSAREIADSDIHQSEVEFKSN